MKINAKKLKNFFNDSSLQCYISNYLCDFTEEGLLIKVEVEGVFRVKGFLDKEAFDEYEPIGKVGVGSTNKLVKSLDVADEIVELKYENNILYIVSDNFNGELRTVDAEYITNSFDDEPKLEYDTELSLFRKDFTKLFKAQTFLLSKQTTLELKNGVLNVIVISDDNDKAKFKIPIDKEEYKDKEFKVCYGEFFTKMLLVVDKDAGFVLKTKTDYPVTMVLEQENSKIEYLLAPVVK